jgi:hypothetical protein
MLNDFYPSHAAIVTPSDTTEQPGQVLYVGATGNVVLDTEAGETSVVFTAVPAGTHLRVRFTRVKVASTATGMKRFWG